MSNNNLKVFVAVVFSALVGLFVKNTTKETQDYKQNSQQNQIDENSEISKNNLKYNLEANQFGGIAIGLDGDSLNIEERNINNDKNHQFKKVRLAGIDAPEYKQKCYDSNKIEYQCGKISADFLKKLISNKFVVCNDLGLDYYNRHLGECFVRQENGDFLNINQKLISSGMAIIYNFKQATPLIENLEKQAKEQKIGLWQGEFQNPKDYRKANPRVSTKDYSKEKPH
ncbi:MAG: thermonuclease family protein [Rickettsiales bacterium]|nr:thermonuclease family protein [Rickettsiales bacterium]